MVEPTLDTAGPDGVLDLMERCTARVQRASHLPVVFGGLVQPDLRYFSITSLRGTSTNLLRNLRVRSGEGLGGKSLQMQRPASVRSYPSARGITRRYDHAVLPERLESILALPVALPGRAPVAVLYLADRQEIAIDERVTERVRPMLTELAHELHLAIDLNRRMESLKVDLARAKEAERPDVRTDVQALIDSTTDPVTREGLLALLGRLAPAEESISAEREPSPLTQREKQVLVHAEQGATNREIGTALGLTDGTVKSYMKAAMAKLGSDNRVRACRTARERGFLD